jgi:hydrogenase maturation factor
MAAAAASAGVQIVTGVTKVVHKGTCETVTTAAAPIARPMTVALRASV